MDKMGLISGRTADMATMAMFLFYQLFFSFATISFICHGISYLDDSVKGPDSASYIGNKVVEKVLAPIYKVLCSRGTRE